MRVVCLVRQFYTLHLGSRGLIALCNRKKMFKVENRKRKKKAGELERQMGLGKIPFF